MAPAYNISPAIWRLVQENPELRDGCATDRLSQEKGKGCRNAFVQHAMEPGSDPGSTSAGWSGPQLQLLRHKTRGGVQGHLRLPSYHTQCQGGPRLSLKMSNYGMMNDKSSYVPQLRGFEAHSSS